MMDGIKGKASRLGPFAVFFALAFCAAPLCGTRAGAAELSASLDVDRAAGVCEYAVSGLDLEKDASIILKVSRDGEDNAAALEKEIELDEAGCVGGTHVGSFSMTDLNEYAFEKYNVSFVIKKKSSDVDGQPSSDADEGVDYEMVDAGICDFSIHDKGYTFKISGKRQDINRRFVFSLDKSEEAAVPGTGNRIKLVIWKEKEDISKAASCGADRELTGDSKTWEIDLSAMCASYGTYHAGIVLVNDAMDQGGNILLASGNFKAALLYSHIGSKKTEALEKRKAFRVYVSSLNGALGINKVTFDIYNGKNRKVYSKNAARKSGKPYYYANISLKALDYKLELYKIKATVVDNAGNERVLSKTGKADERIVRGEMAIQKKTNATCKIRLRNAYIPGGIKNVRFNIYSVKGGKKAFIKRLFGVYDASKNLYYADMPYDDKGSYSVYAYGASRWGKKILLNRKNLKVRQADLGKNGWVYETYAGRQYKFYYKNNKKTTDLTDVLNIGAGSRLCLEINRAACCVTAYAYDSDKNKYIIPVRTFTVSVGRDISSGGSAGSLNEDTSYTPLGSYSVSSNGSAVKYTLKPMVEPDGSTVYARWATHIVGNVYFHAIAVGSQSHYALSPTDYNRLGSPASAGCIRMTVADAKWIYDCASTGTQVRILAGNSQRPGPLGKDATIKVDGSIHYDPTDSAVPTSTKKKDYAAGHISGYMTRSGKRIGY